MARRVTKANALGVTLRGDRNQCAGCGALFTFAALQAAASERGFVVQQLEAGRYMVSRGLWLREVDDMDSLVALLAKMGVRE